MATNRKLGRTTDIRNAMLKTLTTDLILHGKVETTEARAKEVKAIADSLIALAIKEKDNFETVDVKVVKAKLDSKGNKITELVKSKNGNEYLKVVKEEKTEQRQKDISSIEEKIIKMYFSNQNIYEEMQELYGVKVSPDMVTAITDKIIPEIREWQKRQLE